MTAEQLAETILTGDDASRMAAARALAEMDPTSIGSAAPALVLGAGDPGVAEWCVAAIEEMGPPPVDHLPRLAELLAADATDTVYWAATLLGRAGAAAAAATTELAAVAGSEKELAARERAAWALGKIGPPAASALPVLRELAESPSPRLARLALQAIEAIEAIEG